MRRRECERGRRVKGHPEANIGQLVTGTSCTLLLLHCVYFPACLLVQPTSNTGVNSNFSSDPPVNDPRVAFKVRAKPQRAVLNFSSKMFVTLRGDGIVSRAPCDEVAANFPETSSVKHRLNKWLSFF